MTVTLILKNESKIGTSMQRSTNNDALALALEPWVTVHILVDSSTPWVMSVRSSELVAAGKGEIIDKNAGAMGLRWRCSLQANY